MVCFSNYFFSISDHFRAIVDKNVLSVATHAQTVPLGSPWTGVPAIYHSARKEVLAMSGTPSYLSCDCCCIHCVCWVVLSQHTHCITTLGHGLVCLYSGTCGPVLLSPNCWEPVHRADYLQYKCQICKSTKFTVFLQLLAPTMWIEDVKIFFTLCQRMCRCPAV